MEMYKRITELQPFVFEFTDSALLPNMPTELNVKLVLEDVWMTDGITLLIIKETTQMKTIWSKKTQKTKLIKNLSVCSQ